MKKAVAIALLAVAAVARAFYEDSGDVVALNEKNFGPLVIGSDHVWVVEFYAPWCGHCKHFAPEYARAAQNLHGIVRVGAVNCDEEQKLCGTFGIQGFPTVKLFPWSTVPVPKGRPGEVTKEPVEYNGPRRASALANAAVNMLPSFVHRLDAEKEPAFVAERLGKVLLFTDKRSVPTLFKALALEYRDRLAFGCVKSTDAALVAKYGVTQFPSVLVLPAAAASKSKTEGEGEDKSEPVRYTGKVAFDALNAFLRKHAPPAVPRYGAEAEGGDEAAAEGGATARPVDPAEYQLERVASADDWAAHCVGRTGLCAVAVLDPYNYPDDAARQEALLARLAAQYVGRLHVVWFAAREQPAVCRALGLETFPALALVNPARTPRQRTRVAHFRGAFDEPALTAYLDRFLAGGRGAAVLDAELAFRTVDPADYLAPPADAVDDDDDDDDDGVDVRSAHKTDL